MKERLARIPVLGTALRVFDRGKQDAVDPLAGSIAFFAFLSLFPLLLLAVSVAGFVLSDPADQLALADRITESIPGFAALEQGGESVIAELLASIVEQRGTTGAIGLLVLLFSGLRVINAAMVATRVVFRGEVLLGAGAKVRQLLALVGLGTLALASTIAASVAGAGFTAVLPMGALPLSLLVTAALDGLLFLGAYVLLAPTAQLSVRDRIPGALLAGAGWTLLKVFGGTWVANQVASANALYGALGSVIAAMLLFYLAGRLYLYGAVLSVIRYESVHGPLVAPHDAELLGLTEGDHGAVPGRAADASHATAAPAVGAADADGDGPPPIPRSASLARPVDPGPDTAAGSISVATRDRLAAAGPAAGSAATAVDARGEQDPAHSDARAALALVLAAGALAAGWRLLGGQRG